MKLQGYYFITDASLSRRGIIGDTRTALAAGCRIAQYRTKGLSTRAMLMEAQQFVAVCREHHATCIINDRLDIALAVGADGVHLGQDDMPCVHARRLLGPSAVIGVTVHTEDEAKAALTDGASYLAVSPIFATTTKADAGTPVGLDLVRRIRALTDIPIVAIGGITLENAPTVVAAGADAVCAISAVLRDDDVTGAVRRFIAATTPRATGDDAS